MSERGSGRIAASDEYEANEMRAPGAVLHRDKVVGRKLARIMAVATFGAVLLGIVQWLVVSNASLLVQLIPWALAALFAVTALTRVVLRTVVTNHELHIS